MHQIDMRMHYPVVFAMLECHHTNSESLAKIHATLAQLHNFSEVQTKRWLHCVLVIPV